MFPTCQDQAARLAVQDQQPGLREQSPHRARDAGTWEARAWQWASPGPGYQPGFLRRATHHEGVAGRGPKFQRHKAGGGISNPFETGQGRNQGASSVAMKCSKDDKGACRRLRHPQHRPLSHLDTTTSGTSGSEFWGKQVNNRFLSGIILAFNELVT